MGQTETLHLSHRTRWAGDQNLQGPQLGQLSKVCSQRHMPGMQPPQGPATPSNFPTPLGCGLEEGADLASSSKWPHPGVRVGATGEGTSSCPHPGKGLW